jgi:hypothetical protein
MSPNPSSARLARPAAFTALLIILTSWPQILAAQAADSPPQVADSAAAAAVPTLDYTFTWPTFLLCLGLVLGYYFLVLRLSDREFRDVIAERFGPSRSGPGGSKP